MRLLHVYITILFFFFLYAPANGQEENNVVYQGKRYIDINIKSLTKLNDRVEKQQKRLLHKLKNKEKKFANRLRRRDSIAFVSYQRQSLTFDSIAYLRKNDSNAAYKRSSWRSNASVDSLRTITSFINKKDPEFNKDAGVNEYNQQFNDIKNEANYNDYINNLISQHTQALKSLGKGNIGLKGIEKQVFYAKAKMKVFKDISDEPSKAEDLALEALQGQQGFEQSLQQSDPNSMASLAAKGATAADLEKMGYQTKQQVTKALQQKYGNNLGGLKENVGKQIKDYQDQLKKIQNTKNTVKQTKTSLSKFKSFNRPEFKVNPMRGLPLWRRIEKQLNWQTSRATLDGKPALFQVSAMAGFKHTPKLSYGIGIATSIGLGQNWNNVKLSFEGVGLRTYANWQLIYGIGAYAGYERMYKQAAFIDNKSTAQETLPTLHEKRLYSESVLLGLTKSYSINDKWNGSMQVLYDVWWKEKGLRSPIVIRIASVKK